MSSDVPMDQDEDNDEFFSARDELKKAKESPPPQRSDREYPAKVNADNSPSSGRKSKASRKSSREKNFFSDEKAIAGSDKDRRSSKRRKDKNKWDRREYKKEELDPLPVKKKETKKKEVKPVRVATEEVSKTDEESEPQQPPIELQSQVLPAPFVPTGPQPRPCFAREPENMIMSCLVERGFIPKARYKVLRFATTQELVEFDGVGEQVKHPTYSDRAITNNWRRWGAHRTLCDQGGYLPDPQNKRPIKIEVVFVGPPYTTAPSARFGASSLPGRALSDNAQQEQRHTGQPKHVRCVVWSRGNVAHRIFDSVRAFGNRRPCAGSIKVESGPAVAEGHRIGKLVEEMVKAGGFVPRKLPVRKEQAPGGQPQVVVIVKQKPAPGSKEKPKKKEKGSKEKKKKKKKKKENGKSSSTETDSDEHGEDDGSGGKGRKADGKEVRGVGHWETRKKAAPVPPKAAGSKEPRRRKAEKK
ncbi:hypothetical protein PRIPAC_90021 [Pristionchus pacificus]|uniref:Uncharacterized protein n=1 Tax=Pristionchus pacificus TaxID=54126 RepID=A0A2A6CWN3_PRIPA|nr:hypothetical protein PRIPAC_90021 [Pristionchus pacificus]|eukprot:PDM82431.1 hypothetical protein PRIPAC_36824 [Pristionchus pacificus]